MSGVARRLVRRFASSDSAAPRVDAAPADASDGTARAATSSIPDCLILLDGRPDSHVVHRISLPFVRYGSGVAIAASSRRHTKHPAWSNNLVMNAQTTVIVDGRELAVRARLADAEEARGLWPELIAAWPPLRTYLKRVHGAHPSVHPRARELTALRQFLAAATIYVPVSHALGSIGELSRTIPRHFLLPPHTDVTRGLPPATSS